MILLPVKPKVPSEIEHLIKQKPFLILHCSSETLPVNDIPETKESPV